MKHLQGYKSFFEKESTDKYYRDLAIDFHTKLRNFIKEHSSDLVFNRNDGSTHIKAELVDPQYSDLLIKFTHIDHKDFAKNEHGLKGAFGFGYLNDAKYKYAIVCGCLLAPFDAKYLDTRLNKDLFVHEFIHYLDAKRFKTGKGGKTVNLKLEDYYNNPKEYNAHYQEAIDFVYSVINNYGIDKAIEQIGLDKFNSFKYFMINYAFNKDFMKYLNDKYRIKLNKRLYDLWLTLTKKYITEPVSEAYSYMSMEIPKVWYHGSKYDFEQFKTFKKAGVEIEETEQSIFLTSDKDFAKAYAGYQNPYIYSVEVLTDKIFDFRKLEDDNNQLTDLGRKLEEDLEDGKIFNNCDTYYVWKKFISGDWDIIESKEFKQWLNKNDYDGALVVETGVLNLYIIHPDKLKIINKENVKH